MWFGDLADLEHRVVGAFPIAQTNGYSKSGRFGMMTKVIQILIRFSISKRFTILSRKKLG